MSLMKAYDNWCHMKLPITSFATLLTAACLLTAQDGGVTYVPHDKVTAALALPWWLCKVKGKERPAKLF